MYCKSPDVMLRRAQHLLFSPLIQKQIENVFLETSTVCRMSHPFAPAVLKVGPEKVIYGSDHPYSPFQMEIEKLTKYAVPYTRWTAKELKMILGGNLRRILGSY